MIDSQKLKGFLEQKSESSRIEFKLKYEFKGQEKNKYYDEFVKDVAALTNTAGRAADDYAYLIIGAGDIRKDDGTRKTDDVRAYNFSVEQFLDLVNARCYPAIREIFYEVIDYNGNYYGVIEIPPSSAIHHLKRDLNTPGSVYHEGSVLIRRGPAIKVASPDEIKLMEREKGIWSGQIPNVLSPDMTVRQTAKQLPESPKLELYFADVTNRSSYGHTFEAIIDPDEELELRLRRKASSFSLPEQRPLFDKAILLLADLLLVPSLGLMIFNNGSVSAENVRIELSAKSDDSLIVLDETDFTEISNTRKKRKSLKSFDVAKTKDHLIISTQWGRIQPQAKAWSKGRFYFYSSKAGIINLEALIYADNLPKPIATSLIINTKKSKKSK